MVVEVVLFVVALFALFVRVLAIVPSVRLNVDGLGDFRGQTDFVLGAGRSAI